MSDIRSPFITHVSKGQAALVDDISYPIAQLDRANPT